MSARALLAELRDRGVELVVAGDRMRYRPTNLVTPDLLDRLRANKPTLLKLLEWEGRTRRQAARLGCVVRWSRYPTWIELHDPLTGERHEVKAAECLPGVVAEADKHRKEGGAA